MSAAEDAALDGKSGELAWDDTFFSQALSNDQDASWMFSNLEDNSRFFTEAPSQGSTTSTVLASGPETTDSFSSMLENTSMFQEQLQMPAGTSASSASSPEMQRYPSAQLTPATPAAHPLQPKSSPGQSWQTTFVPYDGNQTQRMMGPPPVPQHHIHPDTPVSQSLPFFNNPYPFSQQSPYPSGSGQMQPGFNSGYHPGIQFGLGQQGMFQPTNTLNGGMTASWNSQPNQLSHSFSGPSSSGATVKGYPQPSKQQMQFQQQQQQQQQQAIQEEPVNVKAEKESWGGQQKQQLQELRASASKDQKSLQPIQPAPAAPKGTTAFEDMVEVNRLAFVRGMCWAREQAIRKIKEQLAQGGTVFGSSSAGELIGRTSLEAELEVWFANGGNAVEASTIAARHIADMFANKHPRVHAVLKTTVGFTKPQTSTSLPTVMQRVSDIPKSHIYTFKPPQTGAGKGAAAPPQPVPGENERPKKADADLTFRLVTSFERTIDGQDTIFHYCSDGEIRILNDEDFKTAKARTEAWNKMMEPLEKAALGNQGSGIGAATAYVPTTQADGVIKLTASGRKRKASTSEPSTSPPKKKRAPRKKPLETVPEEDETPSSATEANKSLQSVTAADWVTTYTTAPA